MIHMNGRAYDYNLGRFLSVDPFIQEPGNSQSMNPYSYIMNNPLAGTDPSGYRACYSDSDNCNIEDIEEGETVESVDDDGNIQGTITKREDGSLIVHKVSDNGKDVTVHYMSKDLKDGYQIDKIGNVKDTNNFLQDLSDAANAANPNNPSQIDGNVYGLSEDLGKEQRELAAGLTEYARNVVGGTAIGKLVPSPRAGSATGSQKSLRTHTKTPGPKIISRDGNVVEIAAKGASGTITIITKLEKVGNSLKLSGTHIDGLGKGTSGLKELRTLARQLGQKYRVKEVIIEGGKRTTGANPGKIPKPIKVKVN